MSRSRSPFVTALLICLALLGGFSFYLVVSMGLQIDRAPLAYQFGQVIGQMLFPAIGAVALWKLIAPRSPLDAEPPQLGSQVVSGEIGHRAIELPRDER
jgi:hypothetical protein